MSKRIVTKQTLVDFLRSLDAAFSRPGTIHLIGETSQVLEGWRQWTSQIELTSAVQKSARAEFNSALRQVAETMGIAVNDEHPEEVIPIPKGHEERAHKPSEDLGLTLDVLHFDAYSVAFRFIARGSEPDYHLALNYIHNGWIELQTMHDLLEGLLPEFSFSTIQQDPAEFRRRYGGLLQMVKTLAPGVTHRPTPV